MSAFEDVIAANYLDGEEAATERVARYDHEVWVSRIFISRVTDQLLAVAEDWEAVVEALEEVAVEIQQALGGEDE